MIDNQNWTFCQYNSSDLKAFISLSGEPLGGDETKFLYSVTVTDGDDQEVFQSDYTFLEQAIEVINNKYGHWNFNNLTVKSSSQDGCSSCSAH